MTPSPGRLDSRGEEAGFTLVELVIALLILAIVMSAVAPALWGTMKSGAAASQRSVADGLAVAATEQIRSLPYYEVGYDTTPSYCDPSSTPNYNPGGNPVALGYSTPMDAEAPPYQPPGDPGYYVYSCINWVTASDGSAEAYKQAVVTVTWGPNQQDTYRQESALYPGGEGAYSPADNFAPYQQTGGSGTGLVPTPTLNSATPFASSPTTVINVDWQPVTYGTSPVEYIVEWWTGATKPQPPSQSPEVNGTSDGSGGLDYQVSGLTPGTTYSFDVIAVSGSQESAPSNVVTATTQSAPGSACSVSSINVSPQSPVIDKNGNPVNFTSLSVTVQGTSTCSGLSVEYGVNGSNGEPQAPLSVVNLTWSSGSFTGSAYQSTWSATTYGFVVYQSGSPFYQTVNGVSTLTQQNVTPCQERGSSGHC